MFGKFKNWFLSDLKLNLVLLFLFVLLLFFGTWRLPYSPATWFDEGINLGIAKSLITKGVFSLEVSPADFVSDRQFLITTNYPVLLPLALSLKLFGMNLTAGRLPMVLFLVLFFFAAYFILKRIYSKGTAIMALALVISFAPFYGNGKAVLGEIPGLFYLLGGLLLLREGKGWKRLFLAGLLFGLSAATKPFFLIILPAFLIGEILIFKSLKAVFTKRILAVFSGMLIPLIGWIATILPKISFSEIIKAITYYSNSYAAQNFTNLIFSNFLRFFSEVTPLHFSLLLAAVLIAVFLKKSKKRKLDEIEIILLAFVFINILWYLKTPGWYRYFFPAHIILLLLFPASLKHIFYNRKKIAATVIIFLFLFQISYLVLKRNDALYNSSETKDFSEYVLTQIKPDSEILLINSPSAAFLINNGEIYQFLQINPALFFGKNTLSGANGFYDYVVTNGSIEEVFIDNLSGILNSRYDMIKNLGHYSLYKKIFGLN